MFLSPELDQMVLLTLEIPLVGHEIGQLLLEFLLTVNPSFSAVLVQPRLMFKYCMMKSVNLMINKVGKIIQST